MSPPHLWHNQPTVILSSSDVLWWWKLDPHFFLFFLPFQNCQSLADAFQDSQSSPWDWCSKTSLKESFRRQAQRKLRLFKEFEFQSFETSDKMGCSRANASTLRTTREDPLRASSSGTSAITRALEGCDIIDQVLSGTGNIKDGWQYECLNMAQKMLRTSLYKIGDDYLHRPQHSHCCRR